MMYVTLMMHDAPCYVDDVRCIDERCIYVVCCIKDG